MRTFKILLVFGICDVAIGVLLLRGDHNAAGIPVLITGILLTTGGLATQIRWTRSPSRVRFTPYAYTYALVGLAFLVFSVVLIGAAASSSRSGGGARSILAATGAFLALAIGTAAFASLVAARRIALGQAGRVGRRWLPGWKLFVQEETFEEQDKPPG